MSQNIQDFLGTVRKAFILGRLRHLILDDFWT